MIKKKSKLPFFFLALLTAVIGYRAWHDMQPKKDFSDAPIRQIWVAEQPVKHLPADREPVIAVAGTFGKGGFTPGVPPLLLGQRETNLLFRFDTLPSDLSPLTDTVTAWKNKNNILIEIILDYHADEPDPEALENLIQAVRRAAGKDYWISIAARRSWVDSAPETSQKIVRLGGRALLFDAAETALPEETLAETLRHLDTFKTPFIMRLRQPLTRNELRAAEGLVFFRGFAGSLPEGDAR